MPNNFGASETKFMTKMTEKISGDMEFQEVCIDLPGEKVQCWRSSDRVRVILRKHRDVIFDVNLKSNAIYSVESKTEFYSPREKKLLKKALFFDGERFNIWIGRNFKDKILLKLNDAVVGSYYINELDSKQYSGDPKVKPEPFMVVIGKEPRPLALKFSNDDPYGINASHCVFKTSFDPKLASLKHFGSSYDYQFPSDEIVPKEYVAVTEATPSEIQPQVLRQLDGGTAVEGRIDQIFVPLKDVKAPSPLYLGIATAAANIAENVKSSGIQSVIDWAGDVVTSNTFKESAGYLQENYKKLSIITMKVRVEKRSVGRYRVIFKGRPLVRNAARAVGYARAASVTHKTFKVGSEGAAFIDGGFERTGRAGFGPIKRILFRSAENFRGGMKIQIIGTVIDLIGDLDTVYFSEKGSKDLTEFLGRAGVSLLKAGATAMLGSIFAAGITAALGLIFAAGVSALVAVGIVVGGFILAATIVDAIDGQFGIKEHVAEWAR